MSATKKSDSESEEKPKPIIIRNTTDLQRLKLEKLMQNPEKPIIIPERPKERGMPSVPDFVRNVMGSSAGAGSGEFHVYRHLRRKEYARQKYLKESAEKERLQAEYEKKLEDNKRSAEEKTAKKRAKRLKKKAKQKQRKKLKSENKGPSDSSAEESEEEDENKTEESDGNAAINEEVNKAEVSEEKDETTTESSDKTVALNEEKILEKTHEIENIES